MPVPTRFSAPILSLFRAVFGLMFLAHGVSKFFGLPPFPMPLNPLLTAAGVNPSCRAAAEKLPPSTRRRS